MLEHTLTQATLIGLCLLCWSTYAGTILAFSCQILVAGYSQYEKILHAFQSMGVVLGLSLGGTIYTGLPLIYSSHLNDHLFIWPESLAFYLFLALFFMLWVHNIRLEIWSLDPVRKLLNLEAERRGKEPFTEKNIKNTLLSSRRVLLLQGVLILLSTLTVPWVF
jgi:hypothetical protein